MPMAKAQPSTQRLCISLATASGVLGLLRLFRLLGALVPLGTRFPAVFATIGARQLLALLALQLAHLHVHRLGDLTPALVLRALVEHTGQRALQLLGRRIADALLLELRAREEQRLVDAAVAHLAGRRREGGAGLAVGQRDLLAVAQAVDERLGVGVGTGELLVL